MANTTKTTETKTAAPAKKMVKLTVPINYKDNSPMFVAVNGESYLIQRGEEVEVPDYIAYEANRAVNMELKQMRDAQLITNLNKAALQ